MFSKRTIIIALFSAIIVLEFFAILYFIMKLRGDDYNAQEKIIKERELTPEEKTQAMLNKLEALDKREGSFYLKSEEEKKTEKQKMLERLELLDSRKNNTNNN